MKNNTTKLMLFKNKDCLPRPLGFIEETDKDRSDEPDAVNQREDSSLQRGVKRKF